MEKDNLNVALDMREYKEKLEKMNIKQLLAEKEKVRNRLKVNYIVVGDYYYGVSEVNIADDPVERDRILLRKKVSIIAKVISGQLNKYTVDFALYWKEINDAFLRTTLHGNYVTAVLRGKSIPFADKLSVKGLTEYKKYLLVLSDNLEKMDNFKWAVRDAIDTECAAFDEILRNKFYTKKFLPASIDAVYKNIAKSKAVEDQIAKVGTIERKDEAMEK